MNATSQTIQTIIENTPGYSLDILLDDLKKESGVSLEYLTSREVMNILKIAPMTFRRWIDKDILKPLKVEKGRNLRFIKSEVLAVMQRAD